jgi:hypothetical protein
MGILRFYFRGTALTTIADTPQNAPLTNDGP